MNSSNETFYSLDYWFGLYGFPYILDVIIAYGVTSIWFASVIMSTFSLFILCRTQYLASSFFRYMRLYVANCWILSLLSVTTAISLTHRFFSLSNTYEAAFYGVYVLFMAQSTLFLFSSCIEICLVVERILCLLPRSFRRIKMISFRKFYLILFIFCIAVNVPGIFLYEVEYNDVQLDSNTKFRIWYFALTDFSFSLTGVIIYYFGCLFRDVLPMILKIIINSLSIYLVGKYVRNKQRIAATTTTSNSNLVNFDRKQTYIAIIMNAFSLLEHILCVASYALYFINNMDLSSLVYAIALLFIAIKHFLIFFILISFNSLFRNAVKNLFTRFSASN